MDQSQVSIGTSLEDIATTQCRNLILCVAMAYPPLPDSAGPEYIVEVSLYI